MIQESKNLVVTLLLVVVGLFAAAAAQAQTVVCSSLWLNGFPEQGYVFDAGDCHPFTPASVSLHSGQELYFQNEAVDNMEAKTRLEWAADALVYSSGKYESFGLVPQIRIVYSPQPNRTDANHLAFTFIEFFQLPLEFCPIVIYPSAALLSKDHFYQMIAHEVYHCVQKNSFPAQSSAAVQGSSQGLFWFEGLAQFMSNEVYPINDFEYHPMFGRFNGNVPFFQQTSPYLSEGFFQGLFWFSGSSAATLHAMQYAFSTGGGTAVQDVLTIPRISEAFHEVARRISFLELNDSSGALSPWRVEKQFLVVPDTSTAVVDITFKDFAIQPFEISFPKGGDYQITVHRIGGAKLSIRKVGDTAWDSSGFPTHFVTECDTERKFEGVYTRAEGDLGSNTVRLEITRRDNSACPCDVAVKPVDMCLFGAWQVDHANLREFMTKATGSNMNITGSSGALKLMFDVEGNLSFDYQDLKVNAAMSADGENTSIQWSWNGINNLAYTDKQSTAEKRMCVVPVSGHVVTKATMTIDGQTMEIPSSGMNFTSSGSLAYTCSANTYKYTVNTGPFTHEWIYNRVTVP